MAKPVQHYGRWRIRWVDENGQRKSASFDDYKTAAREVRVRETQAEDVRRKLRAPAPLVKSFNDLCDYWLTHRAPLKRSEHHDISVIRCHLRPAFGPLMLCDLGVAEVDRFVSSKAHLDKKTIANVLTLLVTMLNAAVDLNWLFKIPRIRKPKIRLFERDFRYLRTQEELSKFLKAARAEGELALALYSTAVYTGMRQGELAGLRWDDISFERRLITVQRSFDGPTKSGSVRHVPILDALLPVLRAWRLRVSGETVFPNRDGRMHVPSSRIFQEIFQRVLARSGLPMVHRRGKLRPYIVFHDLRHTFASLWVLNGGDIFRLQKILGHHSIMMTQRYAHLAPDSYATDYGRLPSTQSEPGVVISLQEKENISLH